MSGDAAIDYAALAFVGRRVHVEWKYYVLKKSLIHVAVDTGEIGNAFEEVMGQADGILTAIAPDLQMAEWTNLPEDEWVAVWVDGKVAVYLGDTVTIERVDGNREMFVPRTL